MSQVQRSEARLCSMLVAAILMFWSILPITGGDWRFLKVLRYYEQTTYWLAFTLMVGILLLIGATCKWRSGRQIGLFLSSGIWFASLAMCLNYYTDTGIWVISPTTMLFPILGIFCLVLLRNDIAQKPKPNSKGGC